LWSTGDTVFYIDSVPAGNYYLIVMASNGCQKKIPVVIGQSAPVIADFVANPDSGLYPLTVQFNNQSTGGTSYYWDFGNGQTDTVKSPQVTFEEGGDYVVMLVVTNDIGCSDTVYYTIKVIGEAVLMIPNVFSPNGDGMNDVFRVNSQYLSDLHIEIYNRWGVKVAEINKEMEGWDGRTLSGENAPDGTYYYILKARGYDGQEFEEKGTVTLLR
jgi:gliding motility-associated-like protein